MKANTASQKQEAQADTERSLLAEFLLTSSPDPVTRTMAGAMMTLTLSQVAGRSMTPIIPSMLLVNAGDGALDPLDVHANHHASVMSRKEALECGDGEYFEGTPENARTAMINCIKQRENLGPRIDRDDLRVRHCEVRYLDAKLTNFGSGHAGRYSRVWDDELEWITDPTDELILRLDKPEDRKAFRHDVLEEREKLLNPVGRSQSLDRVRKGLSVSGSLNPAEWNETLVDGILGLGLPMFFLPHLESEPLKVCNPLEMYDPHIRMSDRKFQPVVPLAHLPPDEWFEHYEELLRLRLRELPAAYESSVLRFVHELPRVCWRIAHQATGAETPADEKFAIQMDLLSMTLCAITMGIASLAYHCLGFAPGCPRPDALKLLRILRKDGPMSGRKIQRKLPAFTKELREKVFRHLAAEGLIEQDGQKMITAVPLPDFVRALHARPEFLKPKLICPQLPSKEQP
jgi:hypothetical protein